MAVKKNKIKTEDVLNIDCTKEQNLNYVCKFLNHIKPFKKLQERNNYSYGSIQFLEQIEKVVHGICIRYGYRTQGIQTIYLENDISGKTELGFYQVSIIDTERKWIGTIMGKTLLETEAKTLIKIYAEIKKKEKAENV